MQKLGIPTEIGTDYIAYYDTPVEDLSNGESINIMPGIRKTDYRETARRIRVRAQHSTARAAVVRSSLASVCFVRVLQRRRGASLCMEPGRWSLQV